MKNKDANVQQVGQILSGNPVNGVSTNLAQGASDVSKRVDQLFLKFSAVYGYLWQNMFKDKNYLNFTKKQWAEALRRYDGETIDKAFVVCREQVKLPPPLSHFIELCRGIASSRCHSTYKVPIVEKNFQVAQEQLQAIYRLLTR